MVSDADYAKVKKIALFIINHIFNEDTGSKNSKNESLYRTKTNTICLDP